VFLFGSGVSARTVMVSLVAASNGGEEKPFLKMLTENS
jgi:hypothetical protein